MADNTLEVEIIAKLNNFEKSLKEVEKKTESTFDGISKHISEALEGGIGQFAVNSAKALVPLGIAIAAIKEKFDQVLEGEKIKSLNAQFELLAKNANLVGTELKESLVSVAGGKIVESDLIEAANKGLVTLGENAKVLPQTLEIARKAALVFGQDTVDVFERINTAIATGNTRQLRQIGIVINADKAVKDYAKSLDITVASLTEAGRQQAIQQAILEKGQTAFDGVNGKIKQASNAFKEFNVAVREINETLSVLAANSWGKIFSDTLHTLAIALREVGTFMKSTFGDGAEQAEAKIQSLNLVSERLQKNIDEINAKSFIGPEDQQRLTAYQKSLDVISDKLEKVTQEREKAAARTFKPEESEGPQLFKQEVLDQQSAALLSSVAKTNAEITALQTNELSAQEAAQFTAAANRIQIITDTNQQIQALEVQRDSATIAQRQLLDEQIAQLDLLKNEKLAENAKKADIINQQVSKSFQQFQGQAIAGGIANIVTSLAKGQNAFQNFGKFILGIIGDFAIQIGSTIIATGIAYKSLGDFTGTAPIILGGALVAIGALLKSLSSSGDGDTGGGSGGGSFAGGGIGSVGGTPATQLAVNPNQQGTSINVNIQGNVLDRRETGLEIVNVLQEHLNNNGQVLVGGNF